MKLRRGWVLVEQRGIPEECMLPREERDRRVIELYQKGVPVDEIAKRFCINRATIYSILRRHGIEPMRKRRKSRALTPEEEAELVREYREGKPVQYLLEKYGISTTKLYEILRRHGVELRAKKKGHKRRRLTEEEVEEIKRLYQSGVNVYQIAKRLGRPVSTVYAVLKREGLKE